MVQADYNLLYPLDLFYREHGWKLPSVLQIEGSEMPEPYRRLLVGPHDMTPTLASFHKDEITLHVRDRHLEGNNCTRLVVLATLGSDTPVEFGAIVIYLEHFTPEARQLVLDGSVPLGSILAHCGIQHTSCPQAFLQVSSDEHINLALKIDQSHTLYGRRNVLLTKDGAVFADILEILPPAQA